MLIIDYFTDVLCIWAYGGQIRVDELVRHYDDQVELRYRFMPIFASARSGVMKNWESKGGFEGFNQHSKSVAKQWPHVSIYDRLWQDFQPASSTSAHVVLKAVSLLEEQGEIDRDVHPELEDRSRFEALMWKVRKAFFADGKNISELNVLQQLATEVGIDWKAVLRLIENGEAYASLYRDEELKHEYCLQGSPSFVLNEGRQILYGNVGYRIIEANVAELLEREHMMDEASWC